MSYTLQIQYKNIDDLIPYVNNTRTHNEKQVQQIASSIKEFGFTNPILIDEQSGIIAGHGRVMAAQKLKLKEVPTITLANLSDAQRKAYIIADNKLALNAGWNEELLKIELQSLKDMDFDTNLIGFSVQDLSLLFDENVEKELVEQSYNEVFNVIVECKNEIEQENIFNQLEKEGYKCRVQSL